MADHSGPQSPRGDDLSHAEATLAAMQRAAELREAEERKLDAPPTADELIKLRNVHKTYLLGVEGVPAIRGVDLTVRRGEFIVILGKSGGGKSTMLNLMTTIDKPSRGDVWLCGTRVRESTPDAVLAELRLRRLGFVFQSFNLVGSMTAVENVELPMVLAGWATAGKRRERAEQLLGRVGMGHRLAYVPSQLSGGEAQRVAIARALANRPDILVGDEITGDLDPATTDVVMSILLDLNRAHGVTVVMVTHEVALKSHAHRVIHMLDGRISRVEVVPPHVREAADKAVREAVAGPEGVDGPRLVAGDASHADSAKPASGAGAGAGAGGSSAAPEGAARARRRRVMMRRPGDYPTHQFAVRRFQAEHGAPTEAGASAGSAATAGAAGSQGAGEEPAAASSSREAERPSTAGQVAVAVRG